MTLFIPTGFPAYAATTQADLVLLIAALADPSTATNADTINRVMAKIPPLVQNDTGEPLSLSFSADGVTFDAWSTDASVTLACGLGQASPSSADQYAGTVSFSIVGNARTGTLALNTSALQRALTFAGGDGYGYGAGCGGRPGASIQLTLHLRKTEAGATKSVGMVPVLVSPGIISSTPSNPDLTSYVETSAARAGYIINLSGVTSLTGGGSTTLDGQAAGGASFPVGCVAKTSDSNVGRDWKLVSGTLAATNLALGQVKPTNYSAAAPCYWQVI